MSAPVDLRPAEPEPVPLLIRLRQTVGLAQLHAEINRHRTNETEEES